MAIKGGSIEVDGLRPFVRELKALDEPALLDELRDANHEVAEFVKARATARARAMGGLEARAAATLTARRGQRAAEVSFGGAKFPAAAGSEFGAYRNRLRLLKHKTGAGRGRAYLVRNESAKAIEQAKQRIAAQRNINTGEQIVFKREIRGWNQFRPWRGNRAGAGYWLYPTIRAHTDEIVDMYATDVARITAKAFPT